MTQTTIEPFIHDVVDPTKDKGERWKIGTRPVGSDKKETDTSAEALGVKAPRRKKASTKRKQKRLTIYLRLRRCPQDVHKAIGKNYQSEREKKDGSTELYFEPEDFEDFMSHKAQWMWLDTENFVAEIDEEPKTVAMYNRAFSDDPENPKLKGGERLIMDGHWTDELKEHYIKRYKWCKIEIMKASYKYEQSESYEDGVLQGNL